MKRIIHKTTIFLFFNRKKINCKKFQKENDIKKNFVYLKYKTIYNIHRDTNRYLFLIFIMFFRSYIYPKGENII